jgi:hypothetical protein
MALVGRLEDLPLAEIFQVLSLFRKSGKLTLSRGDTTGVFLFDAGKVFHASNGFSAPSVGEFLVSRTLITERKKLGAILVEMGAISHDALQKVLRDQMQDIAFEFLRWDSGFFNFKAIERHIDQDEVFEDDNAKLTEVVSVDPFVLDLLTKVDEVGGTGTVRPVPRARADGPFDDATVSTIRELLDYIVEPGNSVYRGDPADVVTEWPSDLAELRKLMTEIQIRPNATLGEIALLILRYATRVVGLASSESGEGTIWCQRSTGGYARSTSQLPSRRSSPASSNGKRPTTDVSKSVPGTTIWSINSAEPCRRRSS